MTQTVYRPDQSLQVAERIYKTTLPGLWYIAHDKHQDERGYFSEIAIIDDLNTLLQTPFIPRQVNLAQSITYVTRGFHIESWNKLITITQGTAFCAIADVRQASPTFKQVEVFELGDTQGNGSLFISSGLANSYCVTSGPANYLYLVDALYRDRSISNDASISLFDPGLNVAWPIPEDQMIISDRDKQAFTLNQLTSKVYSY